MGKRKAFKKQAPVPYLNLTTESADGTQMYVKGGVRIEYDTTDHMYKAWIKDAKKRLAKGKEPRKINLTGSIWLPEMGSKNAYEMPD